MCCCFQTFKELSAFFAARFFRSGCKGKSLYYFNQIFLLFFEEFFSSHSPDSLPEDLKNYPIFLNRVAKLGSFTYSTKFFCYFLKIFPFVFLPEFFEELIAFLKADGKDTRSIFISKFFLCFSLTRYQHQFTHLLLICYTVCKELIRFVTCALTAFLFFYTRFCEVFVSNRVAKINSSKSLPNISGSFFACLLETPCRQGFQLEKTFTGFRTSCAAVHHTGPCTYLVSPYTRAVLSQ